MKFQKTGRIPSNGNLSSFSALILDLLLKFHEKTNLPELHKINRTCISTTNSINPTLTNFLKTAFSRVVAASAHASAANKCGNPAERRV